MHHFNAQILPSLIASKVAKSVDHWLIVWQLTAQWFFVNSQQSQLKSKYLWMSDTPQKAALEKAD